MKEERHIHVPEHIWKRRLSRDGRGLCMMVNSQPRLSDETRNHVLDLLDNLLKARAALANWVIPAESSEPRAAGTSHRTGVLPVDEQRNAGKREKKGLPTRSAKVRERKAARENGALPQEVVSEIRRAWDAEPERALRKIAEQIETHVKEFTLSFTVGTDASRDDDLLVFSLNPKFPERNPDLMVYWYLARFLASEQGAWLGGPCRFCKRLFINSDARVIYCNNEHKDRYWRANRREYFRAYMAKRRLGEK